MTPLASGPESPDDILADYFSKAAKYLRHQLTAINAAKARGLVVFDFTAAYGSVITLDLDKGDPNPGLGFRTTSKSGRKHGFIHLKYGVEPYSACNLAKSLGSDTTRENITLTRYGNSQPFPVLIFETPAEAERLRAWIADLPAAVSRLIVEL